MLKFLYVIRDLVGNDIIANRILYLTKKSNNSEDGS